MSTNNIELFKLDGYGAIAANDEAANNFYIVLFTPIPYTLQEDLESDGNKLAFDYLVCNSIYTYHGRNKSRFMMRHVKDKNCDCVNKYSC